MKSKMLKIMNVFIILFSTISVVCGGKYYVSANGDDNSLGTIEEPWASPEKAWYSAKAGDTVFFRYGIYEIEKKISTRYNGHDGKETNNIVYRNYPGEVVTFTSDSQIAPIFEIERDYNVIDSINFSGYGSWFRIGYDGSVNHWTIRNCKFTQIYSGDKHQYAVNANGHANYVTIRNCEFNGPGNGVEIQQNTSPIIAFHSNNLLVYNCNIKNYPIGIYQKHGTQLNEHSGIILRKNFIFNCLRNAISLNASNALVDSNIIGVNCGNMIIYEEDGGQRGDSNTVSNNIFYGTRLTLQDGKPGAYYNYIYNNIFNKTTYIYPVSTDGTDDSTNLNNNIYINEEVVKQKGISYSLSEWQAFKNQDLNSTVRKITWNTAFPDTVRAYYDTTCVATDIIAPTLLNDGIKLDDFSLSQNYPNPFNPSTMINYSLPAGRQELPMNSNVSLKIFDILGREVATLVNEHKPAGTYTVEWNGTNSAGQMVGSGIYFYQLKTGSGFVGTKKMLLIK